VSRSHPRRLVAGGSAIVSAGASSLTGLLVNVAAATTRSASDFGHFSFVYLTVLTMMTLIRAICGEVVLFTDSTPAMMAARRSSTIAVIGLAAAGAAVLAGIGSVLDSAGYAAALAIVPICVQDNYRYLAFVSHRVGVAAWSDVVTAIGPLIVVLFARDTGAAGSTALVAWGASAVVGSLLAELIMRPGHRLTPRALFAPVLKPLRQAAVIEYASTALLYQFPLLLLPAVVAYADVGAMRGLQMAFSPVTILHAALFALLVPRLTARFETRREVDRRLIVAYIAMLLGLTVVIAVVVARTPESWAREVLGDTAGAVQANAWAYCALQGAAVLATAVTIVYRINRTYDRIVRVRVITALASPVLCLAGAAWFGIAGACLGIAAVQLAYMCLLRSPLVRAKRDRPHAVTSATEDGGATHDAVAPERS